MSGMRISQLAEASGLPASTLRFYEAEGLLPAERTPAGYRSYGADALERLGFIGAAKDLGLPLGEIGQLLRVWESGACSQVKAELRPRLATRLAEAEARGAQVAAFVGTLHGALAHLDALPDRAERCDPGCGFLASPAGSEPVDVQISVRPLETERWRAAPVACTLGPRQSGERATRWREAVAGADRTPIDDGIRLTLPVGHVVELAELVVAEHECCAFFDFRLHLDGPSVHLEVRAPAEAAGLLDQLFSPIP
jgi:DNA-binding transcriptional MerR regulator